MPETHHLSAPGLIRSCLRNEPGFAASQWQRGCRKPCFSKPVQHEGANRFCRRPSPEKRCLFRSCFDSNKARQTVRWRRFRGLEFAPDFRAKSSESGRVLPSLKPAKATPEAHHLSALGLIRSCLRNEPGFAASQWQCGCRKPCFQSPFSMKAQTVFAAARVPKSGVCFALVLIAAKPVKPCDGGVFGALNLLLISKRKAAGQNAPGPCHARRAFSALSGLLRAWDKRLFLSNHADGASRTLRAAASFFLRHALSFPPLAACPRLVAQHPPARVKCFAAALAPASRAVAAWLADWLAHAGGHVERQRRAAAGGA